MQVVALGYLAVMIVGTASARASLLLARGNLDGFHRCFHDLDLSRMRHRAYPGEYISSLVGIRTGGAACPDAGRRAWNNDADGVVHKAAREEHDLGERKLFMLSSGNDSVGGVTKLIRSVLLYTFSFEAAGAVILAARFIPQHGAYGIWEAVFHSVSAFCNAGFDLMGKYGQSSLTGYAGDVTVNLVIMALILCGGVGFIVWQDIFACRFDPKKFTLHTKVVLVMTGILLFSGAVLFLLFESGKTMPFGRGY